MPLNIKNREVEQLIAEVSAMTGERKTEAVRKALEERKMRLAYGVVEDRGLRLKRFLENEVWANIPKSKLGKKISKRREEAILGYGKEGV